MNPTPLLNDLGRWLVANLGPLSLELALWTAVVLLILTVLRVQSPALRHLAWILVLLKPLTTLLLQSPISFYSLLSSFAEKPLPASSMPMPAGQIAESALPVSVAVSAAMPSLNSYGMLALLWGAIAIVLLLRLIVGQVFLARLLRRASRVNSGPLYQLLREAASGLGVRRSVQLALAAEGGPLVAGIFRPQVILPRHLAETLAPEQLRLIFAHELAHVRRLDNLALLGQQLAEILFFFHPSTWLCRRGLRLEAEKACDDAVLRRFPQPAHYADSLARVAELGSSHRQGLLLNTFAAAESRLGWRITRILEDRPMSRFRILTMTAVFTLSGAGILGLPGFLQPVESTTTKVWTVQPAPKAVQPETLYVAPETTSPVQFAEAVKIEKAKAGVPQGIPRPELFANEPNPFSEHTEITFTLPESLPVKLEIYDAEGTLVRTLLEKIIEGQAKGPTKTFVMWQGEDDNGKKVPSGLYFYRLTAGEFVQVRKMMLARPEDIVETKGNITAMRGGPATEEIDLPTVAVKLSAQGRVKVTLFDSQGTLVHTLVDAVLEAGAYKFTWNGGDNDKKKPGPGWYMFIVEAGDTIKSYKWTVK